jgi:chromosome segregation ATPase
MVHDSYYSTLYSATKSLYTTANNKIRGLNAQKGGDENGDVGLLGEQIAKLMERLKEYEDELLIKDSKIKEMKDTANKLEEASINAVNTLSKLRGEQSTVKNNLDNATKELNLKISELSDDKTKLDEDIKELKSTINDLQTNKTEAEKKLALKNNQIDKLVILVKQFNDSYTLDTDKLSVDKKKEYIDNIKSKILEVGSK